MRNPTAILLASGHDDSFQALARHLESRGFRCEPAANREEAIERSLQADACVLFVDFDAVALGGREVIALVRSHEQSRALAGVPVVAVAGLATLEDSARCLSEGYVACLTKPLAPDSVDRIIDRIAALRAELARAQPSADREALVERLHAWATGFGGGREALFGMVLALDACISSTLYTALLAEYSGWRKTASSAVESMRGVAIGFGAARLVSSLDQLDGALGGPTERLARAAILTKCELDRIVYALREELLNL